MKALRSTRGNMHQLATLIHQTDRFRFLGFLNRVYMILLVPGKLSKIGQIIHAAALENTRSN
jgi:hypothetical protein